MPLLDVIQPNNPNLRRRAMPVRRFDQQLQDLIDNMIETMRDKQGVGLAAPQVDIPLRLAVIETPPTLDEDGEEIEGTRELFVIINPEITWRSRKFADGIEGCLSIPGYVGEVSRPDKIRVKGYDRNGKKFSYRLKDWTARIFQHEIDHLDGILYIDRLTAPDNFWTDEEFNEMMEKQKEEQEAEG